MRKIFWFVNTLMIVSAEDSSEVVKEATDNFPSINVLAKSDSNDFSIPQPSLDLSPTSLSENAPMIMSLPDLQQNLEETDFSKNFPMDFSISTPELDLKPSFPVDIEAQVDAAVDKDGYSSDEEEDEEVEETEEKYKTEDKKEARHKRDASFPSIFSLMSSDKFQIKFPQPDLEPRLSLFDFGESGRNSRVLEHKNEKRQVNLNSFRPSPAVINRFIFNDVGQFQSSVRRPVRQNRGRGRAPVYPPFDPFNTTYIPLPGPSSPSYALKLQGDNPHMFEKARFVRFRRPIRQSRFLEKPSPVLPLMLQTPSQRTPATPVSESFRYDTTFDFEKSPYFQSFLSKLPK